MANSLHPFFKGLALNYKIDDKAFAKSQFSFRENTFRQKMTIILFAKMSFLSKKRCIFLQNVFEFLRMYAEDRSSETFRPCLSMTEPSTRPRVSFWLIGVQCQRFTRLLSVNPPRCCHGRVWMRFWHGCHSGLSLWNLESGWLGASLETSPIKRGAADVARRHTGGLAHVLGHLGVPGQSDPCHPVFREWQCRDVSKTRPLLNTDNAEMWP